MVLVVVGADRTVKGLINTIQGGYLPEELLVSVLVVSFRDGKDCQWIVLREEQLRRDGDVVSAGVSS